MQLRDYYITLRPSPALAPRRLDLLYMDPIASKWQRLASTNQDSADFLPFLSSLITPAGRLSTTKVRSRNAEVALDALDKVGCPLFK